LSDTSDVSQNDFVETPEHSINKDDETESISELETLKIQLEQEKEKTSNVSSFLTWNKGFCSLERSHFLECG